MVMQSAQHNSSAQMNKGGKFLKKLWCSTGGRI